MKLSPKTAFSQYPIGIRMTLLMQYKDDNYPSFYKEACKLEDIIVGRNLSGKELERENKIDEAIALYKMNIVDMADTPFPYDRLRVIYTKRKQYIEAIRVCEAYIEMCKRSSHAAIMELRDKELAESFSNAGKFPEYVNKLKMKLTTKPLSNP